MIQFDFKGKTILITAGSKGIGFALAREFALNGANVSICSRSLTNLKNAKKLIMKADKNSKILTLKHDLNNTKNIKNLFSKTEKYFNSKIDILINNSGGPPPKQISKTTSQDWERAMNINLRSSIFASTIAIKEMKKKNGEE